MCKAEIGWVAARGNGAVVTWTLDNAMDASRMMRHARCMLSTVPGNHAVTLRGTTVAAALDAPVHIARRAASVIAETFIG